MRKRKRNSAKPRRASAKRKRPVARKRRRSFRRRIPVKAVYRICEVKDGLPFTLFHGIGGSKRIPMDRWVKARVRTVNDGDRGKPYKSGFHVLKNRGTAKRVLRDTFKKKRGRVVVRVNVADLWPKKHSRHGVMLARYMKLSRNDWNRREGVA